MNVGSVVDRLASQVTSLLKVGGAIDFDRALQGLTIANSAFVIPLAEAPSPDEIGMMNSIEQEVETLFGVILAVRNLQDATGEAVQDVLDPLRTSLRSALLGWEPYTDYYPCVYAGGQLIGFREGILFWQDDFKSAYRIRTT